MNMRSIAAAWANNTRSIIAACAIAVGIAIQWHNTHAPFDNPFVFALGALIIAFLLPGIAVTLAQYAFRLNPFAHYGLTLFAMIVFSGWFWWWIGPRAQRTAGIFDAFKARGKWSGRVAEKITAILRAIERRRYGRERTGGWS